METALVYSEDRVHRLRMVLWVVVAFLVVFGLLGVGILVGQDEDFRFAGALAVVSAAVLLGVAGATLRVLPTRTRTVKLGAVTTGVLVLVVGVLLITVVVGWLLVLFGIAILLLALLPDDPDLAT